MPASAAGEERSVGGVKSACSAVSPYGGVQGEWFGQTWSSNFSSVKDDPFVQHAEMPLVQGQRRKKSKLHGGWTRPKPGDGALIRGLPPLVKVSRALGVMGKEPRFRKRPVKPYPTYAQSPGSQYTAFNDHSAYHDAPHDGAGEGKFY